MPLGRLMLGSHDANGRPHVQPEEVELYHRTYTTLLRSSGETHLRVLEPSHRAMRSSLHPMAADDRPDLGAFLYAVRRLPDGIAGVESGACNGSARRSDLDPSRVGCWS